MTQHSAPSTQHSPVIGLAGGIASGKSTVAKMLGQLGCIVVHSDDLARAALDDPSVRDELVSWWGEKVLNRAGKIDRRAVATIVFENPDQRQRLEALTHPWIEQRRRDIFSAASSDAQALVIDAPLLFEANIDDECDAVVFVDAPPETRQNRVATNRGWDTAELVKREDSQLPLDEKQRRADYIVSNVGSLAELMARVQTVLGEIIQADSR